MLGTPARPRGFRGSRRPIVNPLRVASWFAGHSVPDIIEFTTSDRYLNRPNLYPRQATLLKLITLQPELFTAYDEDVIAEWIEKFEHSGDNGIQPDIAERIRICKAQGRPWFRETLGVIGRRGGKNHLGAICASYVLWNYHGLGDPQAHFGVDRDKRMVAIVFAGKREQAKVHQWRDLKNMVIGSPCFEPYISRSQAETLTVYAPHDMVRIQERLDAGTWTESEDLATFELVPKESTVLAGRGPTSMLQIYDEMAHLVSTGQSRSAEEVYDASTPALDQFGEWAFLYEPSSPWQKTGKFFENYQKALEKNPDGTPAYPEMLMVQLTSWDIYEDYERAADLGFQPLVRPIQAYDAQMAQLERANPETFAVERRSKFAAVLNAYLNADKVKAMFLPWGERVLTMQHSAPLSVFVKAHGDPSRSGANFGFAIGHPETRQEERFIPIEGHPDGGELQTVDVTHCVFDYLHAWRPTDFADNEIHYPTVEDELWDIICRYHPDELTFDQWNSVGSIQRLRMRVQAASFPKRVTVHEKTASNTYNWSRSETFKTALNMGWVHAPAHELAELELTFLQDLGNHRIEPPTAGPVQTKDVADCIMEVVMVVLGDQIRPMLQAMLGTPPSPSVARDAQPFGLRTPNMQAVAEQFRGASRNRAPGAAPRMSPVRPPRVPGRGWIR